MNSTVSTDDLSNAVAALRDATVDSLAAAAADATAAAQAAGLTILAAAIDIDATVVLDEQQISVKQAVAAAAAGGAALLFVKQTVVDAARVAATIREADLPPQTQATRTALLQELKKITGWTSEIELGFPHQGVMVVWSTITAWAEELDGIAPLLGQHHGRAEPMEFDDLGSTPTPGLDQATITELATRLAAVPQFRQAIRPTDRETAARHVPDLDRILDQREGRWQVFPVLRQATEMVQAQVDAHIEQLKPRHHELAVALAADGGFRSIRTADARQRFAQDWILSHTDGLKMPSWWIKELVATAKSTLAKRP